MALPSRTFKGFLAAALLVGGAMLTGSAWSADAPAEQAAGPAIAGWEAAADPSPLKAKIPANLNVSLPIRWGGQVVRSQRHGQVIAVKDDDNRADTFEIIDLALGRKTGRLIVQANTKEATISPDGSLLAVQLADHQKNGVVQVYSLKTSKLAGEFPVTPKNQDFKFVGFAINDQLVTTWQEGFATHVEVWDTKTGQRAHGWKEEEWFKSPPHISPGGKYLVSWNKEQIHVYDLSNGKTAAEWDKPRKMDNGRDHGAAGVVGMAFSPDGTMLAGNFEGWPRNTYLVVWEMATGKQLQSHSVEYMDPGRGAQLDWLPDGSAWLIGNNLVDRSTGRVVHKVADAGHDVEARFPLTKDALAVASKARQGRITITSLALPRAEIEKAVTTVKAGGRAEDANLPPLTQADWNNAREVKSDDAPFAGNLAPDAPAKFAKKFSTNPVTFRKTAPPPGSKAENGTRGVLFAGRSVGQAVVVHDVRDTSQGGFEAKYTRVYFDRVDLGTGQVMSTVELPPVAEVLDVSVDGAQAVVRLGASRVDIWSTEKGGKQVVGFRPFDKEEKDKQNVAWAALIDAQNVLVANAHGKLALFSLSKCEAVWTATFNWQSYPAVSSGRKYGVVSTAKGPWVFDTLTGESNGVLPGPAPAWQARFSFSPETDRVAAAGIVSNNPVLAVWELKKGAMVNQVVLPKGAGNFAMNWLGTAYCLVGHEYLIDLEKGIPLWQYKAGSGGGRPVHGRPAPYASQQPDDSLYWYVTAEGDKLAVAALPHEEAKKVLTAAKPEELFAGMPGSKVTLELNVPHTDEARRAKVETALKKKLGENGYVIADGAPLKLVATVTSAAGREIEYRMFGQFRTEKVQTTDFESTLAFMTADGQTAWECKEKSNNGQFFLSLKQGQTVADVINERNPEMGIGLFLHAPLPKFVPKPKEKATFGESRLTVRGVQ